MTTALLNQKPTLDCPAQWHTFNLLRVPASTGQCSEEKKRQEF